MTDAKQANITNAVVLKHKDGTVFVMTVDDQYPAAVSDDVFKDCEVLVVIAPDCRHYKNGRELRMVSP